MILNKYLDEYGAIKTLEDCSLKFTSPADFNDPFDSYPAVHEGWTEDDFKEFWFNSVWTDHTIDYLIEEGKIKSRDEFLKYSHNLDFIKTHIPDFDPIDEPIKLYKKIIDKEIRICCFSMAKCSLQNQLLMWSHYSDSHKGVRFHFDYGFLLIGHPLWQAIKVDYSDERVKFDSKTYKNEETVYNSIHETIRRKLKEWEYEQEYRVIRRQNECKTKKDPNKKSIQTLDFDPSALRQIDFGINCLPETENDIIKLLNCPKLKHVKVNKCELNSKEFELKILEYKR